MSDTNEAGAPPPPEAPRPDAAPPAATSAGGTPPGGGYGGAGKRLLARIIDALVVGIPVVIVLAVIPGVRPGGAIGNAISALAGFAYFLFLETSRGATLGKQWLGLRVTDEAGASPISMDASARRNWWMLLGLLGGIPVIGLLTSLATLVIVIVIAATISSDGRNQGWHDKLGGTLVPDRGA